MKKLLIKQAIFLPVIYFGFIILASLFAVNYSHMGQHASELGINPAKSAVIIFQAGVLLTSLSMMLLAIGLAAQYGKRFTISALLIFAFGVTFVFGAIFPIGSPWHGAYGIGLFIMILPFVFLYELNELKTKQLHNFSIAAGFLMFFYFWLMIARLDPVEYRGLTQRLFGLVVFGWFSYIAYQLSGMVRLNR